MHKPTKIAIYMYALDPSGGVKVLFRTANNLKRAGYEVVFYVAEPAGTHPMQFDNACEIMYAPHAFTSIFQRIRWLRQVKSDADIAIATFFATAFSVWLSSNRFRKRLYYIQAYEPKFFTVRLITIIRRIHYYILARLSYSLPLVQIVNCEGSKQGLHASQKKKAFQIEPGIDPAVYFPKTDKKERLVIGHISRKEHRKGSMDFFKAMHLLRQSGEDFDICIAYDFWPETLGLEYQVVKPANEMELADFYRSCDIVVSTVWDKGFGYPPLESMACGAVCFGTPMDFGTPYVDFVPIQAQNPQSIVDAFHWYKNHIDAVPAMKDAGLKTASSYYWSHLTQRWVSIIES